MSYVKKKMQARPNRPYPPEGLIGGAGNPFQGMSETIEDPFPS